ncbi:MAG: flagellar protein FlgN [Deltaproteobacteria bacterium]|nr:flagellar protein FlgN [Deltaproteobacteria bacterium]MBW2050816.1 flagellar protein FlgN [Deltaproteobacteria bacterium]MBW2141028.1 flagellar protein FlgN [Deltaproteobacteria bacterium]MBW2322966.1 flagellar protein FlgN [Deltaproteobacteria bacterium]
MYQADDNLLALLKRQISHYQKLNKLLEAERKNLIKLDLDNLQKITKVKESTIQDIRLLVEPIAAKIKDLAQKQGLETDPIPTLAQLAGTFSEPMSGRLRKSAQDLARIKTDVFRHNQDNHNYIKDALGLIENSLGILTGTKLAEAQRYLPTGQQAVTRPVGSIKLNREI